MEKYLIRTYIGASLSAGAPMRELSQMQHKARSDRVSAPLALLALYSSDFLATLGLLSNRVQRVNLHSIKIRQCRPTQN